ncbi:MAG: hypothetical protein KBA06_02605 [Saprospiraceae bacterium]|nr:hypothetical protein [Saprospiraceae bacterium]
MKAKLVLFVVVSLLFSNYTYSQVKLNKDDSGDNVESYFKDSGTFKDKLWYGGGVGLGLGSGFGSGYFNFGFAPMIGYKLIKEFSGGIRLDANYNFYKFTSDITSRSVSSSTFSTQFGPFLRYKFLDFLFLHAEYGYKIYKTPFDDNGDVYVDANNNIIIYKKKSNNVYLGAGISRGDIVRTEFMLAYNVLWDNKQSGIPFDVRFAITYNF